jgi:hypothetical protein
VAPSVSRPLWLLHRGGSLEWANGLIVAGLIGAASFFWLFLVPLIVAGVVSWLGVVKGGLARELHPV